MTMASIYILGAGAMGSLWATHLHHAFSAINSPNYLKHTVQFLSTRSTLNKNVTFTLNSPYLLAESPENHSDFEIQLPIVNTEELALASQEEPVIILLCTKSYHALSAVNQLKPKLNKHSLLVLFQNGLGSQHKIIDTLIDVPIYAAVSTEGVNKLENGTLIHAGKGLTRIGPLNEFANQSDNFSLCMRALSYSGMDTQASNNIWRALWEKLAINCAINPFTGILNCPNGEIKDVSLFQETWPKLKIELTEMLNIAGFQITSTELEGRVFQVLQNTHSNISSMLQDLRANRRTEIEDINGFASHFLAKNNSQNQISKFLFERILEIQTSP